MPDFNKTTGTVFVTGASGFVGRSLVTRLLNDSSRNRIVLLSRSCQFEDLVADYKDRVVVIKGDINNLDLLVTIIQTYNIEYIYHLAAEAIVSEYIKNPRIAYLNTVQGVTSLLEAVRISSMDVKKVIISTSYKVYGRSNPPYNEETSFSPGNTYETAKACQDFIAQDYFRSFKVPVIIFRTVNVYGPGDNNLTRLVPRVFSDIKNKKNPTVYSSVRDNVREFVYIDDLIDALLLIEKKAEPGEIFCIGGESSTIYELVKSACFVADYMAGIDIFEAGPSNETKEHALDISKIKSLGWKPTTSLLEGLKKSFLFYNNRDQG